MARNAPMWLTLVVALVGAPAPADAQIAAPAAARTGGFAGGTTVRVPSGETRQGDLYAAADLVEVAGRLTGDLIAVARQIHTTGPIDGDLFAAGRSVDIRGPVRRLHSGGRAAAHRGRHDRR